MIEFKSRKERLSYNDVYNYVRKAEIQQYKYMKLKNLYDNENTRIKHKIVEDTSRPNNKISVSYPSFVVDNSVGYFLGGKKPISYSFGEYDEELAQIFEEIHNIFQNPELLEGKPYHLYHKLVRAVEFGIPQKRERMIIIGTEYEDVDIERLWKETQEEIAEEMPSYFERVTVQDAIANLPEITDDGVIDNPEPQSEYQKYLASQNSKISNHTKTKHSAVAVDRMSRVNVGENFTALEEKINSVHSGAYGRLCWEEQAPTITTRFDTPAGGRFIHPTENRTLSPREAARIQSFPDDFEFYGNKTTVCKTIGNAVPPKISYFLARLVEKIMESEGKSNE